MKFQILIPSYNRANYLQKNLSVLSNILTSLSSRDVFTIVIYDNHSSDNTEEIVKEFLKKAELEIIYHKQERNIGCRDNLIDIIIHSNADYFMLLGDDDYLSQEYLESAIDLLKNDEEIGCILPAFIGIDEEGNLAPWSGRDLGCEQKYYRAGFENLYRNSMRAHQLSGIIIKNSLIKGCLEKAKLTNLYPQVFVTSLACLKGNTVHLPQFPIKVTQTKKKDWSYDRTGLLTGIFENYKKLGLSQRERFKCEKLWINKASWRITHDWYNPFKQIPNIFILSLCKNTSVYGHFVHPFLITYHWIKNGSKISYNLLFRR